LATIVPPLCGETHLDYNLWRDRLRMDETARVSKPEIDFPGYELGFQVIFEIAKKHLCQFQKEGEPGMAEVGFMEPCEEMSNSLEHRSVLAKVTHSP
jgi:hypothetical protein